MQTWCVNLPQVDSLIRQQEGAKMRFRLLSQWGAIFARGRDYNWIAFTVIELDFDYDKISSRVRILIGLMGVSLIISIPVGDARKGNGGKLHLRMRDLEDRATGGNFLSIEEAVERLGQRGVELDFRIPEALIEELERRRG